MDFLSKTLEYAYETEKYPPLNRGVSRAICCLLDDKLNELSFNKNDKKHWFHSVVEKMTSGKNSQQSIKRN